MNILIRIAVVMIASLVVILTTGCGGSTTQPVSSTFSLAVENSDGLPSQYLGPDPSGYPTYDAFYKAPTTIRFVWAPSAPKGVQYSISHYYNGIIAPAISRGGPTQTDGSLTFTPTTFGDHKFEVTATYNGISQTAIVILQCGKGMKRD